MDISDLSTARSYTEKLISSRAHLIHKIKARDKTGRWAHYFVYVSAAREKAFLDALNVKSIVDLTDWGEVIASCYGEKLNEEVRELLKDRYGFEV